MVDRGGGLAARSGTEFTWFGRVRQYKFSFKFGRAMSFGRFSVFLRRNIKKRFLWPFLMDLLDIRRRDVWTVHRGLHLSWFGIHFSLSNRCENELVVVVSQPVSRMLPTVLEWLTDFLTGAIMESRKTARSKAVASLHLLVVDNRYTA